MGDLQVSRVGSLLIEDLLESLLFEDLIESLLFEYLLKSLLNRKYLT